MNQAELARLCGVSGPMASKWKRDGLLAVNADGGVNARETLQRLAGHLDDRKHRAALKKLDRLEKVEPVDAPAASEADQDVAFPPEQLTGKARRDAALAELAEIELSQVKRDLMDSGEVAASVREIILGFKTAMDLNRRREVQAMATEMSLTTEDSRKLQKLVANRDRRIFTRFAETMARLAADAEAEDDRTDDRQAAAN